MRRGDLIRYGSRGPLDLVLVEGRVVPELLVVWQGVPQYEDVCEGG